MTKFKATAEFTGLKGMGIDSFTEKHVRDIAGTYASKFSDRLQNDVTLKVHIRRYKSAQENK